VARNYRFQRKPEAEGEPTRVPAVKTFSYAIEVFGCVRPVLTVSGSEDRRGEWIARAIAIAEAARTGAADPQIWEAEIGTGGVDDAEFTLIHPDTPEAGGSTAAARSGACG
jgi:hypothetical protein